MKKAENPRGPKPEESRNAYASFCIKYMIDHGEYPNTEDGRKQAAGHCYDLYDRAKNDIQMEKITLCATMSVALTNEHDSSLEISEGVTMLVVDNIYNKRYFPKDEAIKSVHKWNKIPIVLNHFEDIENVVGHLEEPNLTLDGKLRAKPFIDNYEKSHIAKNYIKEQQRIGNVANVSISMWFEPSWETINGIDNTIVARDWEPAHLGIVVHGACTPKDGCGIGLMKAIDVNKVADVEYLALLEKVKENKRKLEE